MGQASNSTYLGGRGHYYQHMKAVRRGRSRDMLVYSMRMMILSSAPSITIIDEVKDDVRIGRHGGDVGVKILLVSERVELSHYWHQPLRANRGY